MTQIIEDDTPKPAWKSITLVVLALIAGTVGAKYKALIGDNTESIVTLVGLVVAAYGRWRAGGVHIPVLGAKEK